MSPSPGSRPADPRGFRHEAWFYDGEEEFVDRAASFVDDGLRAGESVFVVVDAAKIEPLRAVVGEAPGVAYADMRQVGHNPARIIPAWRRFLAEQDATRAVRGIGEPVHARRAAEELVECHVYEALLNCAFDDLSRDFWLLCPYDSAALAPSVCETAHATHPYIIDGDVRNGCDPFAGHACIDRVLELPLPSVPSNAIVHHFSADDLGCVRAAAAAFARRAALSPARIDDFVLGVHEVAANSVLHGPGRGALSLWTEPDRLLTQVHDPGQIDDPLVGRVEPDVLCSSGRGLWLANQMFDLVQIRSSSSGAVVRMHMLTC